MLKGVDEAFFQVEKLLNLIAAMVIMAIMLIGTYQVFGRKLLSIPVPGYVDWIEMFMTVFAFVAISYTQRLGGHVRMEIILGRMKGRLLYFFEIFGTICAIFIVAVLAYYGYEHFQRAFEIGDSTIDIEIPIWPSKLLVPFAFAVSTRPPIYSIDRLYSTIHTPRRRTHWRAQDRNCRRTSSA